MKDVVFWDIKPCSSCKNRLSEERIASIIRVTKIGELGTTLADVRSSMILVTLMMEVMFLRNVGSYKSHMA
jgi:hypothetical protein